jgi:hypothetical protein
MFKINPFAGVTPFRNGGSMPTINGNMTLATALQRVEAAEAALSAARAAARSAAKRESHSVRGLFEDSKFILRASGEKWTDQARDDGWKAGVNFLADSLESLRNPDPADPLYHIAKRLRRDGLPPVAAAERRHEKMEAAGFFTALGAGDYDKAAAIYQEANPELSGKGAAIVAAGKRARMSADAAGEVPEPEKGSLASRIILAGKKRRNEV